jgi:magnesium transporter
VLTVIDLPEGVPAFKAAPDVLNPPPAGSLRWIDVQTPTPEVLETLRAPFGLHPLAIEDCLTFEQRPKLEEYPGHLFVVIHELTSGTPDPVGQEIHAFLGTTFLITVHSHACKRIHQLADRVIGDPTLYARGIAFLYYLLADGVASQNGDVVDTLADSIEEAEEDVLAGEKPSALPRVFELKRALAATRRALSPQRDLFATLARLERTVVDQRTSLYFRDVYDRIVRSVEAVEVGRELLSNVLDAHFSLVSQRTNEIVKRLTILSAIFLPLTFVTGFFGQNFHHLPFDSTPLMWGAIVFCLLLPFAMLIWFRHKRWV